MCFGMPKPIKPPDPPNKLDTMNDALRNNQIRRAGAGMTSASTNVTLGNAGTGNITAPMGGKIKLGG